MPEDARDGAELPQVAPPPLPPPVSPLGPSPILLDIPPAIGLKPLVSEIALLLDFLTSRPNNSYRGNATLKLPEGSTTYAAMLATYAEVADLVRRNQPVTTRQVSFLLETLDYLGSLTNPVGGDSIAFSVLVADSLREGAVNGAVTDATTAFPSYVPLARKGGRWHFVHRMMLLVVLVVVGVISIDLHAMSSAMKVLGEFKKQTEVALAGIAVQEAVRAKDKAAFHPAFPTYCPKPDIFERHWPLDEKHIYICAAWFDLQNKRDEAAEGLNAAVRNSMICGALREVFCRDIAALPVLDEKGKPVFVTDQAAATVIGKITFFLLAPVMSLLGALISVIRAHVNDIRERLLTPRNTRAASARLVLGMSAGIVLSYFYAPGGQQAQGPDGLIEVANLTIPAVAFLVGAGADFVFGKLEALTADLFKREPK